MGSIRDAHSYLSASILNGLAITAPYSKTIKKAWKFIPPARVALADTPCAFSTFALRPVQFKSGFIHKRYTIHIQVAVGPAETDADQLADMAAAFLEAIITKLAESKTTMTLGGNINGFIQELRGAEPETVVTLQWGGIGYIGLDLFLDIDIDQVAGYATA